MIKQCIRCHKISRGLAQIERNHSPRYNQSGYRPYCKRCHDLVYSRPYKLNGLVRIRPVVRRLMAAGFEPLAIAEEAMISLPMAKRLIEEFRAGDGNPPVVEPSHLRSLGSR